MFNSLCREINDILGDDFVVICEYNTTPENNDKILDTYKNVGVLHVNYGTLKLLPGNQGMTGTSKLDLLMCVKEGVVIENLVSAPLYDLLAHQNGVFGQGESNYRYLLNYHLPTSTGEVNVTQYKGVRYVEYSLPVDITMASNTLMLGGDFDVELSLNGSFTALKNIATSTLSPNVTLDSHTTVNTNTTTSDVLAKVWGMQIVFEFDATDALHKALYAALDDAPHTPWIIRYKPKIGSFAYKTRKVIFHDSSISFPRGQFTVVTLNLAEAS